jgi:hypothetical protein
MQFTAILKSQIPSIKLQINLKFQYPMIKTFAAVVPHRCTNHCPPVVMPEAQLFAERAFGILILGHWNLFEIWFLMLGIFMILIKQVAFVNSAN